MSVLQKKRIMFVGEASFLSTGFSTYYRELLQRLASTGKYEIAEIGSYAREDDSRVKEFINGKWKFYGGLPKNQEENTIFQNWPKSPRNQQGGAGGTAQFGEWVFDRACADFKPDIVIDIRDWWMLEFQERSVFRPFYKWIVMPTVDAEPQNEMWIKTYENADVVCAYSDYGINTLKRQSVKMRVFPKPMRPGVDMKTFVPSNDKYSDREDKFMIKPDVPVIGTVMRNQSRKLYPDLINAFARMKNKYRGESQVDKAVLLIHSSWPDNAYSFDYPLFITRLQQYHDWIDNGYKGSIHDFLQTYKCHSCGGTSIGFAQVLHGKPIVDGRIKVACTKCGKIDASPPVTGSGFTREELADVYRAMDLYVQCSNCEGDGMPIQEAKACGVPVLATDYSAMTEKVRRPDFSHLKDVDYTCNKGGEPIPVERFYYEPETSCKRAMPDVEAMADSMRNMISDPQKMKKMSAEARECVEENYDWDKIWKNWEYVLDNVKPLDRSKTWDSPIELNDKVTSHSIPDGLSDEEFISWLYKTVLGYPSVDYEGAKMWMHQLNNGISRDQLLNQFVMIGNQQSGDATKRNQIRAQVDGVVGNTKKNQEWL